MFKEKMKTPAIPERVFAMCKLLEKGPLSEKELKDKMEPDYLRDGQSYFEDYRDAAKELDMISVHDSQVSLLADAKVISDMSSMRKHINSNIESLKDGAFYSVTKAYFSMNSEVKSMNNIAQFGPDFTKITEFNIDATSLRAWRFWIAYLGFAYLHDMFVIPNTCVFLEDIIEIAGFETGKRYPVSDFIEALKPMVNIILTDEDNKKFNYGMSNGLRSLENLKKIRIEHILDFEDMWLLDTLTDYSNDRVITHITVL